MSRKDDILECATRLFAEKGFAETSTMEIAEQAGVAQGTLFYHFKNKEGIICEIFSRVGQTFLERMTAAVMARTFGIEKIEAILRFNASFSRTHSRQLLIFFRVFPDQLACGDSPLHALVTQIRQQVIDLIRDCLATGMEDGTIVRTDPEQAAYLLDTLMFGMTHVQLFNSEEIPDVTESAVSFFRRALSPASA